MTFTFNLKATLRSGLPLRESRLAPSQVVGGRARVASPSAPSSKHHYPVVVDPRDGPQVFACGRDVKAARCIVLLASGPSGTTNLAISQILMGPQDAAKGPGPIHFESRRRRRSWLHTQHPCSLFVVTCGVLLQRAVGGRASSRDFASRGRESYRNSKLV